MKLLVLAVAFCGVMLGQDPPFQVDPLTHSVSPIFETYGLNNGHWWIQMEGPLKAGYLMGAIDGILDSPGRDASKTLPWPSTLTFSEIVMRLDAFYSDKKNLNIPVIESACLQQVATLSAEKAAELLISFRLDANKNH